MAKDISVTGCKGHHDTGLDERTATTAQLIYNNIPFVINEALKAIRKWKVTDHDIKEDIVQSGLLAIIAPAHKYDGSRGVKFISFVRHHVWRGMHNTYLFHQYSGTVKISQYRAEWDITNLQVETGCTREEAVDSLVANGSQRVGNTHKLGTFPHVFSGVVYFGTGGYEVDATDLPSEQQWRSAEEMEVRAEASELLSNIPEGRDKDMYVRHVMYGDTLKGIGIDYGISKERVRQICEEITSSLRGKALQDQRVSALLYRL
jgi:RNA polymerase sigma factor (sigma-70 family)